MERSIMESNSGKYVKYTYNVGRYIDGRIKTYTKFYKSTGPRQCDLVAVKDSEFGIRFLALVIPNMKVEAR